VSVAHQKCLARLAKPFQHPPLSQAPQALLSTGLGHPCNHNRRDKVTIELITCCASKVGRLRVKLETLSRRNALPTELSALFTGCLARPAKPFQQSGRPHQNSENLKVTLTQN
ncbi:MAG: hypothetical protein BJ554DRAFT_404, partial [Olpidium bornovanus]